MKAMAITDHGNMFGAVAFHDACRKKGLKPILGCEVYVAPGSRLDRQAASASEAYNHFTLLATSDAGYHNLIKLVSAGFLEGFYYRPRIDKELLAKHSEGLVGLSGCLAGEIAQHVLAGADDDGARRRVGVFSEIFGKDRFCLEVQEHGIPDQRRVNQGLAAHPREDGPRSSRPRTTRTTSTATTTTRTTCCCASARARRSPTPSGCASTRTHFYLKSAEEMAALFPDYPEALLVHRADRRDDATSR